MAAFDPRRALAEAALKHASEGQWRAVRLRDLVQAAGDAIADFYPLTAADVFDCVDEYFDRIAGEGADAPDAGADAHERVFDAAMARFESMEKHRAAVLALDKAIEHDPLAQAGALARTARSARWILALAGEDGEGMGAMARAQALALVLRQARAAWAKDDAGDFTKTMAALDSGLRRSDAFFENMEKMAAGFRSPQSQRPKAPADEAPPSAPPEPTSSA